MTERAAQLFQTADGQMSDLITLLSAADGAALHLPCPGREKLGDGTVAAVAMHTADNYVRIVEYLAADLPASPSKQEHRHSAPLSPTVHGPRSGHGHDDRAAGYAAQAINRQRLLDRLAIARARLSVLAELSDERLAAVPPASDMRFADGQRTLEQIVIGLLQHQRHQLDALAAALAGSGPAA